jgi:hypothetical protein
VARALRSRTPATNDRWPSPVLPDVVEDSADIAAYDRAKAALTSGTDELIRAEFANRLIAGETPVRVYREFRGLTQMALSEASGVNRVQIAKSNPALSLGLSTRSNPGQRSHAVRGRSGLSRTLQASTEIGHAQREL